MKAHDVMVSPVITGEALFFGKGSRQNVSGAPNQRRPCCR